MGVGFLRLLFSVLAKTVSIKGGKPSSQFNQLSTTLPLQKRLSFLYTQQNNIMLAISASTLLLISALASASPVPQPQLQRRSAAVIPFRTRAQQLTSRGGGASEPKVFNKEAALQERNRVAAKYANIDAKAAAVGKANANGKRDSKNIPRGTSGDRLGPYDVALKRRQSSGSEALTDQFDTIDECERILLCCFTEFHI